jgi:hypothetical protein
MLYPIAAGDKLQHRFFSGAGCAGRFSPMLFYLLLFRCRLIIGTDGAVSLAASLC